MITGLDLNEGQIFSNILQKTWATFTRQGDPNHDDIPFWQKFSTKKQYQILWNTQIEVMENLTPVPLVSSQKI